jgi:hypothetical protein
MRLCQCDTYPMPLNRFILFCILIALICSCKDDDSQVPQVALSGVLPGYWYLSSQSSLNGKAYYYFDEVGTGFVAIFYNDHTRSLHNFEWNLSGNQLLISDFEPSTLSLIDSNKLEVKNKSNFISTLIRTSKEVYEAAYDENELTVEGHFNANVSGTAFQPIYLGLGVYDSGDGRLLRFTARDQNNNDVVIDLYLDRTTTGIYDLSDVYDGVFIFYLKEGNYLLPYNRYPTGEIEITRLTSSSLTATFHFTSSNENEDIVIVENGSVDVSLE